MKVWHKILVAPGLAIVFLLVLGATTYSVLTRQNSALDELYGTRFANYELAAKSSEEIVATHAGVYRLFTWIGNLNDEKIHAMKSKLLGRIDAVSDRLKAFAARPGTDADERGIANTIVAKLVKYRKAVDNAVELSTVDINTGMAAMQTADFAFQAMSKDLDGLVDVETKLAKARYESVAAAFSKVLVALLTIVALAFIVSLGVALVMSKRIVRPLNNAIGIAGRIASGDLTTEVALKGSDETADLLRALRDMNSSLRRIVGEVRGSTDLVATASREILQGNTDLSTRTEEQASALEETSASMQQMAATVGQNAQNAKVANELAIEASSVAAKGGDVVRQAVGTMNGITESSKKISDIIGVIDSIAFQTNILALNAAVEAARAGEQGRGFAVVASEVRNLAQRSAAAAKEIKELITDSVGKVDAGSRQVNDAGRTMDEIVASVRKVSALIAEIAAASQEQAQGIEQVSETMSQLEKVTQQNAAMVEEASAAAGSLEMQSQTLSRSISAFRLIEGQAREPAAALPSRHEAALPSAHAEADAQLEAPGFKAEASRAPKQASRKFAAAAAAEGWQEF